MPQGLKVFRSGVISPCENSVGETPAMGNLPDIAAFHVTGELERVFANRGPLLIRYYAVGMVGVREEIPHLEREMLGRVSRITHKWPFIAPWGAYWVWVGGAGGR
jgi:hypothetical protein